MTCAICEAAVDDDGDCTAECTHTEEVQFDWLLERSTLASPAAIALMRRRPDRMTLLRGVITRDALAQVNPESARHLVDYLFPPDPAPQSSLAWELDREAEGSTGFTDFLDTVEDRLAQTTPEEDQQVLDRIVRDARRAEQENE